MLPFALIHTQTHKHTNTRTIVRIHFQARLVWESLLYIQPGLWQNARGRAGLEALLAARLEESHFSHCGLAAERKRLVGSVRLHAYKSLAHRSN
jgi:hypothetical protein